MADKIGVTKESVYLEGERIEKFETPSGIPLKEVYRPDDLKDLDYSSMLGDPGEYPCTRGIHPNMYRGRMWTRRFQVGFGTPKETNERIKYLYKEGSTGITLTCDEPTMHGFDSDHPLAEGAVGVTGVPTSTLEDLEETLKGFPPDEASITLSMGNIVSSIYIAMYSALAEKQGINLDRVLGTIQVDPFFIINTGSIKAVTAFMPLELDVRLAVDIIEYCSLNLPKMNWLCVNGYNLRDTGISAVQEGAFTLATAFYLIEKALERGLSIDQFAPRAAFLNSCSIDFFEEIAKFRAMRRLWSKTLKERFGAKNPRSLWFRVAVQTAGSSYTTQQPLNNIVRGTTEFLSGVLSGLQSFMIASYDEGLSLPTEESSRIALRIQQIVGYETGVTKVVDPLAGSYYVESLTNEMEKRINSLIKQIEDRGGMYEAIRTGWLESEINTARVRNQRAIEKGEKVVVGLNKFTVDEEPEITIHRARSDEWEKERKECLKKFRAKRNNQKVKESLSAVTEKVKDSENMIPIIIKALKTDATLGEITNAMREAYGFKIAMLS